MNERDNDPGIAWGEDATPRSGRFGDVYFSAQDGLAETRAVFLQGCGLPERWRERDRFVVAELGFGTGLNIAALLDLWRRERSPAGRLHVFSIEAFPVSRDDAIRALGHWPELSETVSPLLARWPPPTPGFHRIDLPEFGATIDLAVMDVRAALEAWSGQADSWFLDGFAPSANPAMWSDDVLALVAARSAPDAVAATFTVAGVVRRGLQANGFEVEKRPGFGRKRERLEARLTGERLARPSPQRVAVIGGGIAGAAAIRALRAEGVEAVLIEAEASGAGASGNPAGLVTPRFDAGGGDAAAFFAQAFERAVALYEATTPEAIIARGALQLETGERDAARFDRIAAQPWWNGALPRLDPQAASELLHDPAPGALWIRDGLVIENRTALQAWIGEAPIVQATVADVYADPNGFRLVDPQGRDVLIVDAVVLTAGWGLHSLRPDLSMTPARGQANWVDAAVRPRPAAWGGYAVPTRTGFLYGATFDRGQTSCEIRDEDTARNAATLTAMRPTLAMPLRTNPVQARARIRATTRDHLPVAGELEPGLWLLGGLGSRGLTTAPLLAEHVIAGLLGLPSPLPANLARRLEPARLLAASPGQAAGLD